MIYRPVVASLWVSPQADHFQPRIGSCRKKREAGRCLRPGCSEHRIVFDRGAQWLRGPADEQNDWSQRICSVEVIATRSYSTITPGWAPRCALSPRPVSFALAVLPARSVWPLTRSRGRRRSHWIAPAGPF